MTEKLYDRDSHLASCDAVVRACERVETGYAVLLDRTVLFPEGGGQQTDLGTVGEATVLECREQDDEVVHIVDRPLAPGTAVRVALDWERRFDYMQQHTGEHLLSFAFYTLFDAKNVGFHLADGYTTIDFDKPLIPAEIAEAELLANTYVWRNLPVTATFYADEAAIADLPLRKHAEGLKGPIRIVAIEDADCCTCCAPHCKQTGEVGQIFIADSMAYKGGCRITFYCGKRALRYARKTHEAVDGIARRFSVSRDDAEQAVSKLSSDYTAARHGEKQLALALNGYMARELLESAKAAGKQSVVVGLLENLDTGRLKDLAQAATPKNGVCLLLSEWGGKLAYAVSTSEGFAPDAAELIAAVNAATNGRGGGRGTLAQGMAPSPSGAKETAEQLKQYFLKRLS